MIDHVGIDVRDLEAAKSFYEQALAPLGYTKLSEFPEAAGFGEGGKPDFWVAQRGSPGTSHVAIRSPNRGAVDAFYEAAIAAGGTDNGPPGLRPHYHQTYYSAFVLDPGGNNVEAVCHSPD